MSKRARTALSVSASLLIVILGLTLSGGTVGHSGLRFVGCGIISVAGLAVGIVGWRMRRNRPDVDGKALAALATARAELERANPAAAAWAASEAVSAARTTHTRNQALTTLAWAALGQGYAERARAALDRVEPSHVLDLSCFAAVECARGETEVAIQALEIARSFGTLTCTGAKLLVDCHVRAHGIERAVLAAFQNRKVLGAANCKQVLAAARTAGVNDEASRLLEAALYSDALALSAAGARVG